MDAGVEYGFFPNWSLAIEHGHLLMSGEDVTFTPVGNVDLVGLHLSYRFSG